MSRHTVAELFAPVKGSCERSILEDWDLDGSGVVVVISGQDFVPGVIGKDLFEIRTLVFKSDRGALSAKDERETLLTTRSSSEKLLSLVLS